MNKIELEIVQLLEKMKSTYNVTGIKAEFEAEGTRLEEAMRLKDVCAMAGLGLNIKIGGCEALKDMFDSISLGAERIIAPMIETPYALKKFLKAAALAFGERLKHIELLANIETITACKNFKEMLSIEEIHMLKGIVIGRVDMVGSLGLSRDMVNSKQLLDISLDLADLANQSNLDVVIGGGVSVDSLSFFKSFPPGHLTRFETRKVIFACPGALDNHESAFLNAIKLELLWLENKQAYYSNIAKEDHQRLEMLRSRYQSAINELS